jgi:peptidoglycan/xylan/chitin deacetylase (PgdA/CDA1 family)
VRSSLLDLIASIPRWPGHSFVRCLYLHHVYDDERAAFERMLQELRRLGRFLSTEDLGRLIRTGRTPRGRHFHLSLDDGFDNVYRNAFPILQGLGVPATVFVPTGYIDATDEAVLLRWWNKRMVRRPTRPLRWAWLSEMHRHGIDIGCHTRMHTRLADISSRSELLHREVHEAKWEIEQRLGAPCRTMAWPFGTLRDIDDRSLEAIQDAGFELCFGAVRGRVAPGTTSRWMIPRHWIEPGWPWPHVRFFALGGREVGPAAMKRANRKLSCRA